MTDTYKADLVTIDLNDNTIYRSKANHIIAENDKNANQFGVRIVRDGNPVNLTGVNCTGYFVRHVTDETIVIQGAIDTTDTTRSVAYVKLPQACYAQEGSFSLAINIYGSGTNNIGESVTVRIVDGVVVNTKTTTTLDPSNVVPDITELLAKISAMETATANANTAADSVKTIPSSATLANCSSDAQAETFILNQCSDATSASIYNRKTISISYISTSNNYFTGNNIIELFYTNARIEGRCHKLASTTEQSDLSLNSNNQFLLFHVEKSNNTFVYEKYKNLSRYDVVNALDSSKIWSPLSAAQGKALKTELNSLSEHIETLGNKVSSLKDNYDTISTSVLNLNKQVNGSTVSIEWEQGAYTGADYKTKSDSSGQIRTKTYIDFKKIKSLTIDSTKVQSWRSHFYDSNYNLLNISNNSFVPTAYTAQIVYATIAVAKYDSPSITPTTDIGLQVELYTSIDSIVGKLTKAVSDIEGLQDDVEDVEESVTKTVTVENGVATAKNEDGETLYTFNVGSGDSSAKIEELDTRVTALDGGTVKIEWEQGAYTGADYKTKSDSSGQIRTKTYIDFKKIKSLTIDSTKVQSWRSHFYDSNYNLLNISNNSFVPTAYTAQIVYATIAVSNYATGITPTTDIGLQYEENESGVLAIVSTLEGSIDGLNSIITFKQNGNNELISNQLIPRNVIYYVSVSDGYKVKIATYDADKKFIMSTTYADYEEPSEYDYAYFTVYIKKTDNSAINVSSEHGFSFKTFEDYIKHATDRDIIIDTKHQHPIIHACIGDVRDSTLEYKSVFNTIMMADLHGVFSTMDDANEFKKFFSVSATYELLNAGDIVSGMPRENGVNSAEISQYMEKAIQYGVYHCMGQHECGFAYETTRTKSACMTHTDVFNTFISPMKTVWNLPDLSTIYYYKDFTTPKMRLISLYQYNAPIMDDPSDSTKYKYPRGIVWHGQAQLDWLCNTLNSTPDGYGVIILMHQNELAIDNEYNSEFFNTWSGDSVNGGSVASESPIYDIVDAYIKRSSLTKTYTASNQTKYPVSDGFTESVSVNFANAKGKFLHYITGDAHIDLVGKIKNYGHPNIGITASGTSADAVMRGIQYNGAHTRQIGTNANSTLLTFAGYSMIRKRVILGRIGQQFGCDGKVRMLTAVPFIT